MRELLDRLPERGLRRVWRIVGGATALSTMTVAGTFATLQSWSNCQTARQWGPGDNEE